MYLIETLRREGYEFQVRKPEVIFKEEDGVKLEPMEELLLETPEEYIGAISTLMQERNAEVMDIETDAGQTRYTYKILTRNLLGLRTKLVNLTKGNVTMNNFVLDYVPVTPQKEIFRNGVLIASETGTALAYSMNTVQERGDLFIEPGAALYEGMIIGINKYPQDMEVNAAKARHKSAVRVNQATITQTRLKSLDQYRKL